ncbi:MAG: hypothetical protein LUF04_00920 [Bacteroides sp.]|nr:hypothetical protein [Bacteroides sp.]
MVTVRPSGGNRIIKYTQTSADGKFRLTFPQFPEEHILHVSILGYAPQSVALLRQQTVYNIRMQEQVTALKEVVIKAPSIHEKGDTIQYMVSRFADAQDRSLADVLKKMPGIEVEKSGAIKYNGVSINKFYIEGHDMLGGQYGLATHNIQQKDVGSVEVLQNHQPIKALEDLSFSQNPAINIRLKEDARSRWTGTAKLGLGASPLLWNVESSVMRFAAKKQSLSIYKTNNIGLEVTREARNLNMADIMNSIANNYQFPTYIQVSPSGLTDIEDRLRFNKSHLVSTNNLWSLGRNWDLTHKISYTHNRLTSDNSSRTTYFLEDSTWVINESQHALTRQNYLSTEVNLTANTAVFYFKNRLQLDMRWNDVDMSTTGSYPNEQKAYTPYYKWSNDLEILKRKGRKAWVINSYNLFLATPPELTVQRKGDQVAQQNIDAKAFFTHTNSSYSMGLGAFSLSLKGGLSGVVRSLNTDLTGLPDSLGILSNDLTLQFLNIYLNTTLEFNKKGWRIKADAPLSSASYRYKNIAESDITHFTRLRFSPQLYTEYKITTRFTTSLTAQIAQRPVEEQHFYSGWILNNYRTLSQGILTKDRGNNKLLFLHFSYKNPLQVFFSNFYISRDWQYSPLISNRSFTEEYVLDSYLSYHNRSSDWRFAGNISKGIEALKGTVTLRGSYSLSEAKMIQDHTVTDYNQGMWSLSVQINSRIAPWFNLSYHLNYRQNGLKLKDTDTHSSNNMVSESLTCNFTPSKSIIIRLTGDHYYNKLDKNPSKNLFLADTEFIYTFRKGWETNLSVTNIFNQKTYSYTQYNGLTSFHREYKIRPRNVLASLLFRF